MGEANGRPTETCKQIPTLMVAKPSSFPEAAMVVMPILEATIEERTGELLAAMIPAPEHMRN